jgi:hypothetical protein
MGVSASQSFDLRNVFPRALAEFSGDGSDFSGTTSTAGATGNCPGSFDVVPAAGHAAAGS